MVCEVVILTLSAKDGGRCVAAYDIYNNKLIRLVSNEFFGSALHCNLLDKINLLDVVTIKIVKSCPLEHQSENVLIDLDYGLKKTGRKMKIEDIFVLLNQNDNKQFVFSNNNYLVKADRVARLDHSLEIIRFDNMRLYDNYTMYSERPKTIANFYLNGKPHVKYRITDRNFFGVNTEFGSGYAIISLPPTDDWALNHGYYKYISAIYNYSC